VFSRSEILGRGRMRLDKKKMREWQSVECIHFPSTWPELQGTAGEERGKIKRYPLACAARRPS